MLHFEPVTLHNREALTKLSVSEEQAGFIESVADCLREADTCSRWRPLAIYDDTRLVGFAMYGFFWLPYLPWGRLWMDRLLIDARWQGLGYGTAALKGLLKRLHKEYPRRRKIYLSVVEGNENALSLYKRFGFQMTGEKDTHGENVMVCRWKP